MTYSYFVHVASPVPAIEGLRFLRRLRARKHVTAIGTYGGRMQVLFPHNVIYDEVVANAMGRAYRWGKFDRDSRGYGIAHAVALTTFLADYKVISAADASAHVAWVQDRVSIARKLDQLKCIISDCRLLGRKVPMEVWDWWKGINGDPHPADPRLQQPAAATSEGPSAGTKAAPEQDVLTGELKNGVDHDQELVSHLIATVEHLVLSGCVGCTVPICTSKGAKYIVSVAPAQGCPAESISFTPAPEPASAPSGLKLPPGDVEV
jgi:hypothetical protein